MRRAARGAKKHIVNMQKHKGDGGEAPWRQPSRSDCAKTHGTGVQDKAIVARQIYFQ